MTWSMVLIHPHWVRMETSDWGVISSLDYLACYAPSPKLNSEEKFTVSLTLRMYLHSRPILTSSAWCGHVVLPLTYKELQQIKTRKKC